MNKKEKLTVVNKVSFVSLIGNIFLSAIKVIIGILGSSAALVADGFHSMSDVFSTVVVVIGIRISMKDQDEEHQYGHEKVEAVMAKLLAIILLLTGLFIGYEGIKTLINETYGVPSRITILIAILSIVVKEGMYRYTLSKAIKIESSSLKADAWHHRTDALSSLGSLAGILGARFGYPILDPIAAIGITFLVIKVAVEIYIQSVKELIDTAAEPELVEKIEAIIWSVDGVKSIDSLKTRIHGNMIYADIEIGVDAELCLKDAHNIAEAVHEKLERKDKETKIKHCMIHVNPN